MTAKIIINSFKEKNFEWLFWEDTFWRQIFQAKKKKKKKKYSNKMFQVHNLPNKLFRKTLQQEKFLDSRIVEKKL